MYHFAHLKPTRENLSNKSQFIRVDQLGRMLKPYIIAPQFGFASWKKNIQALIGFSSPQDRYVSLSSRCMSGKGSARGAFLL